MTDRLPPTAAGLARAVEMLRAGLIVAFPTDTVYGVAVSASQPGGADLLVSLKQRPAEKRIPILVSDLGQALHAGWHTDDRARRLVERFWPGALTIVLAAPGRDTQAFRSPDHAVALELIRLAGPLLATSANRSGEPDALSADDVLVAFATQRDALAAVVDGGHVPGGVASTVVDLTVTPARLLREGPISREMLSPEVELVG